MLSKVDMETLIHFGSYSESVLYNTVRNEMGAEPCITMWNDFAAQHFFGVTDAIHIGIEHDRTTLVL